MLEAVDMLSLPGDSTRPNDDAFCHSDHLAAVFDGATGLGVQILPVDSDAAWIARRGAEGLILHECENLPPREILRRAAADAQTAFNALALRKPAQTYEIPFASMMCLAERANRLEALWFGDCAALVKRAGEPVQIVGDAFAKRAREAGGLTALATRFGVTAPAASRNRPEFLDYLRTQRNGVNSKPGRWLFSPDVRCAAEAQSLNITAPPGTQILLLSDGFLALASDYHRYDAESLIAAAASQTLRALYNELRAIEAEDAEGRRYPRFKSSDDATAILLRVR